MKYRKPGEVVAMGERKKKKTMAKRQSARVCVQEREGDGGLKVMLLKG